MRHYVFFHLLLQSVVEVAFPLPMQGLLINPTTNLDLSPLPVLEPPANLSECVQSNYCNNGTCVLVRPSMRISCSCEEPFVDSEAGLCTIKGKSRRLSFIIRW